MVAGVGIAVAVLAGALTVGVSVRASLRDLVVQRLGETDDVILSSGFFRAQLASDVASHGRFAETFQAAVPLIALEGFVSNQAGSRRASRVQVYAVDDRFWKFHHLEKVAGPEGNDALISEALAREIETSSGQSVLLRIENASAIPTESLYGGKEDVGRTVRLTVRRVLPATDLGEFSLSPRQGSIRAIFVPLRRMQVVLAQQDKVNAILLDARAPAGGGDARDLASILDEVVLLEDMGLRLRALDGQKSLSLESSSAMLSDSLAATAESVAGQLGMKALPTLTYLANTIRSGDREIPYSVISALDLGTVGLRDGPKAESPKPEADPIVLNTWAANALSARAGDVVSVDYYVWETEGRLATRRAEFRVAEIVPIEGAAADRDLVPEYPGITDSDRLADWDPPFPIDLRRVRPADEDYWKTYRATPKAFIPIDAGRQLWRSRFGSQTAVRIRPPDGMPLPDALNQYGRALRAQTRPAGMGLSVVDARAQSLAASEGATDFGEYFTYFSMFLVASALLLAALFFKLGIEQRLREVGLLQALGFDPAAIRRLFVVEAIVLSVAGGILGMGGAIAYGAAIMLALRTWWVDAVGTTSLTLHVDLFSLAAGAVAGVLVSVVCIWWSLRSLAALSSRRLLTGAGLLPGAAMGSNTRPLLAASVVLGLLAVVLVGGAEAGSVGRVAGFFGAGAAALGTMLCLAAVWLRSGRHRMLQGHGWWPIWRLGFRNATFRQARSVLCIALIAFATFVVVALEAFKRDSGEASLDRHSGAGGYPLLVESLLPIVHDLNDASGRDAMNLSAEELAGVRFTRFRVRPGDDTSCLNLYQPKNPRILGASPDFVNAGRFAFESSAASTPEETANPWLLLDRELPDGAIPVIADANSMTYVLHAKLGDDLVLPGTSDRPVRLRFVGALRDSIFQGELVMAEGPFVRTFPEWEGYRFFLVDVAREREAGVTTVLESRLTDFGVDVASTADRLAGFHRVEYTYLSTFQMLGSLGLILGTVGLGAVLLRNVLERRRELALLRALGYRQADFFAMVVAENVFLLICGLAAGTLSALLAIAPALLDRGGQVSIRTLGMLLLGVLVTGLIASVGATVAALRSPLLPALRAE
ncbi:MAG: FtsX-like permease family protein [Vicinamibacterales bacterium]|nr:FtsX-like permease family protein [Vicinamibacterales bacterium]